MALVSNLHVIKNVRALMNFENRFKQIDCFWISFFEKCDARLILDFNEPESLPDFDKSKSDFQSAHLLSVLTMAPESNTRQIKVIVEELTLADFNNELIRIAKPMKTG